MADFPTASHDRWKLSTPEDDEHHEIWCNYHEDEVCTCEDGDDEYAWYQEREADYARDRS